MTDIFRIPPILLAFYLLVFSSCDFSFGSQPYDQNEDDVQNEDFHPGGNWTLSWSDEFNDMSLDTTTWNYDIGTGINGWGNNEWQYYTSRPANIGIEDFSDSYGGGRGLYIQPLKESYGGSPYTSAKIHTKGKVEQKYGRIEARIKLPVETATSQGIWPAFWMLGTNIDSVSWPACGEIDIMELVGKYGEEDTVHGTIHYGGPTYLQRDYSGNSYSLSWGDFGDDFHIFAIEWEPGEIRWYVDNKLYSVQNSWWSSQSGSEAPFDRSFYIILNVAIGGEWPGYPDSNTTLSDKRMIVDYVRIYE